MRKWREEQGLTQAEVAHRCGVQPNTIARLEQGIHLPRPELLKKLLALTGLTSNDILASIIDPPTKRPRGRPRKRKSP